SHMNSSITLGRLSPEKSTPRRHENTKDSLPKEVSCFRAFVACLSLRRHGAVQDQFAASFRSPLPLYLAYCGYAHSGRDRPEFLLVAAIVAGAVPCSRHFSRVPIVSNVSGPSPPRQCPMPGTMNKRVKSLASAFPIFFTTLS